MCGLVSWGHSTPPASVAHFGAAGWGDASPPDGHCAEWTGFCLRRAREVCGSRTALPARAAHLGAASEIGASPGSHCAAWTGEPLRRTREVCASRATLPTGTEHPRAVFGA